MADFEVGAEIKGRDRFGPVAAQMERRVSGTLTRISARAKRLGSAMAGATKRIGMVGLVAGGAAAAGLAKLTTGYIANAAELGRVSKTVGVSVEKLQGFQHAATQFGLEGSSMNDMLKELNNRLGDLRSAGGPIAGLLDAIGTKEAKALKRSLKDAKDTESAFLIIVGALEQIENQGEKTKFLDGMFGGPGQDLARVESLREFVKFMKEAEESTSVTGESAEQAIQAERAWNRLKSAVGGVANLVGLKLTPVVTKHLEQVKDWVKANEGLIADKIQKGLETIAKIGRRIYEWFRQVDWKTWGDRAERFASVIASVIDNIGGLKGVAMGLAGYMAGTFLLKIGQAVAAIRGIATATTGVTAAATAAQTGASALGGLATVGVGAAAVLGVGAAGYGIYREAQQDRAERATRKRNQERRGAQLEGGDGSGMAAPFAENVRRFGLIAASLVERARVASPHEDFLEAARSKFANIAGDDLKSVSEREDLVSRIQAAGDKELDRRLGALVDAIDSGGLAQGLSHEREINLNMKFEAVGVNVQADVKGRGVKSTTRTVRRGMALGDG